MTAIPHSPDVERAVLGTMLNYGTSRVEALDQLAGDDFHDPFHARIFTGIESLFVAGSAVDVGLVARAAGADRPAVEHLVEWSVVPSAFTTYLNELTALAGFRRTLELAEALRQAALAENPDDIDALLTDPLTRILPNYEAVAPSPEIVDLEADTGDTPPDFALPGLLARGEVWLGCGPSGHGKSTLLRQVAVCAASGLDPFTRIKSYEPRRVLIVDCQESQDQAIRELSKLRRLAGTDYARTCFLESAPQGIDLSTRKWQRWLDAKVAARAPDLVIIGPLYNMVRGAAARSKSSEETAELAMNALGDLMIRRNCALMIEAHAPHGEVQRPRGSKLWEDWPDFGHGLVVDEKELPRRAFDVIRFRGDRHDRPRWPYRYMQGVPGHWPWEGIRTIRIDDEATSI